MIGEMLKRNYDREISESASNSQMRRASQMGAYSQMADPAGDQDLTQSLLSGDNST